MRRYSKLRRIVASPAALSFLATALSSYDQAMAHWAASTDIPEAGIHSTRGSTGLKLSEENIGLHLDIWCAEVMSKVPPPTNDPKPVLMASLYHRLVEIDNGIMPASVTKLPRKIDEAVRIHLESMGETPFEANHAMDEAVSPLQILEARLSRESWQVLKVILDAAPWLGSRLAGLVRLSDDFTTGVDALKHACGRITRRLSSPLSQTCPDRAPDMQQDGSRLCRLDRIAHRLKAKMEHARPVSPVPGEETHTSVTDTRIDVTEGEKTGRYYAQQGSGGYWPSRVPKNSKSGMAKGQANESFKKDLIKEPLKRQYGICDDRTCITFMQSPWLQRDGNQIERQYGICDDRTCITFMQSPWLQRDGNQIERQYGICDDRTCITFMQSPWLQRDGNQIERQYGICDDRTCITFMQSPCLQRAGYQSPEMKNKVRVERYRHAIEDILNLAGSWVKDDKET